MYNFENLKTDFMLSGSEPKSFHTLLRIRTEFGGHLFAWALLNHTDG